MRALSFMVLSLVMLAGSAPGHAEYKTLATAWENWTPPAYGSPKAPGQTLGMNTNGVAASGENETEAAFGHRVWEAKVTGLPDLGRFIAPPGSPENRWTVQNAGKAIRSAVGPDDLESIVLSRNPAILSASAAFRSELDGFDQVSDLNAVLSRYTAFTTGVMAGVGPMKGGSDMERPYPFPAGTGIKSRIILENAAMAALTLNIAIRDKITAVRNAYWNLGFVHDKRMILKETLSLFEQLHDIASAMYKTGKTSYQDVIQISIKKEVLKNRIASLKEKERVVEATLVSLMDLPGDTAIGRPRTGQPETAVPGAAHLLITRALERRQELLRMDHAVAKMELMIEMAESMVLPPLDMGLSKNRIAHINTTGTWSKKTAFPDNGPRAFTGAGRPTRPWFGTAASWLAQTRKKLTALRHKRQNLKVQIRTQVQSAWFNLDDALRSYHLFKGSIIDLSASALDVSTREYEAGSISFAETAGAYNNWLNARLSLARAKRDAAVFRANLQKTVGVSF